jgi:hypothetical protein
MFVHLHNLLCSYVMTMDVVKKTNYVSIKAAVLVSQGLTNQAQLATAKCPMSTTQSHPTSTTQ